MKTEKELKEEIERLIYQELMNSKIINTEIKEPVLNVAERITNIATKEILKELNKFMNEHKFYWGKDKSLYIIRILDFEWKEFLSKLEKK